MLEIGILVASSREDAWIETRLRLKTTEGHWSRPPARTRGLKPMDLAANMGGDSRVLPRGRVD